jgi:ABC-type anion transport system duplicated permease subunit
MHIGGVMAEQLGFDKETLYAIGLAIAAVAAGFFGYFKKPRTPAVSDPVLTGIGFELGNREQIKQLIEATQKCAEELKRIADAITDRNTESTNDRLDSQTRLLTQLAETLERILESRPVRRRT